MSAPERGERLDLPQLREGWLHELQTIRTWLATLGHGDSVAAKDTQYVLDVAASLDELVGKLAPVWAGVQAYEQGELPRRRVRDMVEAYEPGQPAGN